MKTATLKSTVAAVTGLVGSLGAFFYGQTGLVPITGIGLFVLTLMIQYGALKVKILAPLGTGLFLFYVLKRSTS